ncbi:sigma-54-dependent Fis family transcriptional regulator [Candidatus Sumerlaeota bacterium]|nr:sigma-54-dependent Fis family transcriptional regulator [Candidatus Sumerlaeota bacterium]
MYEKPTILLVEDDEGYARRLMKNLEMDDFSVEIALGGNDALERLSHDYFDLVLTDVKMPDLSGLDLIEIIRKGGRPGLDTDIPIVVLTSINSVDTAVKSMKMGAADYITKESERPEIILRLKKVLAQSRLIDENRYLKNQLELANEFSELIGDSEPVRGIKKEISELAGQEVSILITGETGVGKELVARALHRLGKNPAAPFIDVNCAALPDDNLLQSDLFGHEKGAFTGAIQQKKGKFELAGNGALFLDEISELTRLSQGKILKALENRRFSRLGGAKEIKVSCRFIFATNTDLQEEVNSGRFREDLYYRVNVFPIYIPPLRERRQDIPLLARFFLHFFCKKYNKPLKEMEQEPLDRLIAYLWPGNVRELRNIMERLVIRSHSNVVTLADLEKCGLGIKMSASRTIALPPNGINLDDLERDLTSQALEQAGWNQKKAADLLGISIDRMNSRVKKFGFTHPAWRKHKPGDLFKE